MMEQSHADQVSRLEEDVKESQASKAEMEKNVSEAVRRGFRIIMIDECMVTKNTWPKTEWSNLKTNILMDLSVTYEKPNSHTLCREQGERCGAYTTLW